MAKIKRNTAVVKRSIGGTYTATDKLTTEQALERVMAIYSSEGYRDRTMDDYRYYWAEFVRVLDNPKYVDDITTESFRTFINILLRKRGLSPVTVNIRMNAIRAMFNRLYNEGLLGSETNPVAPIRKLKTDQSGVKPLTDDQLKRLFAQIDTDGFAGYRDYVAMLTMVTCGLRINEINALEITDIDFDNNVILLPGAKNKNRKNRMVPITPKVHRELRQLIDETLEYFGNEVTHVFVNNRGEPVRFDRIRKRMRKYGQEAGLDGECRFSPHNLRHTFAVNFLKNGGDIRTLMSILGHTDLSTTQVYLNYTDQDISEKFNEVSLRTTLDI